MISFVITCKVHVVPDTRVLQKPHMADWSWQLVTARPRPSPGELFPVTKPVDCCQKSKIESYNAGNNDYRPWPSSL